MLEIYIFYSKYLFLWLLLVFLFLSFSGLYEQKQGNFNVAKKKMYRQRWVIVGIHLNAFMILSIDKGNLLINWTSVYIGIGMLVFLCLGWIIFDFRFNKEDGFLWNCVFLLLVLSIILLQRLSPSLAQRQLVWIYISFTLSIFISHFFGAFSYLKKGSTIYLIIGWILLILPFFLGEKRYGANNWVEIGKISFQPSEIVKMVMIFYLASVFHIKKSIKQLVYPTAMIAGYVCILVLQRDLGGAFIYFMTFLSLLYISIGKEVIFLGGVGLASVASIFAYRIFPHVQVRVEAWLNPWKNIDSRGYQIAQSLFALGSWGWMGSGLTKGYAGYVPAVTTDFIFAALCEEFGSLFGIGVIIVFILMLVLSTQIIIETKDTFHALIGAGCISIFSFQSFLILGGVLKMIPLTGVTLPFVSYGGSSMFINMFMFKFIQWIGIEKELSGESRGKEVEEHSKKHT